MEAYFQHANEKEINIYCFKIQQIYFVQPAIISFKDLYPAKYVQIDSENPILVAQDHFIAMRALYPASCYCDTVRSQLKDQKISLHFELLAREHHGCF